MSTVKQAMLLLKNKRARKPSIGIITPIKLTHIHIAALIAYTRAMIYVGMNINRIEDKISDYVIVCVLVVIYVNLSVLLYRVCLTVMDIVWDGIKWCWNNI